jgi:DNA-binding IclR family transcriptional regulator
MEWYESKMNAHHTKGGSANSLIRGLIVLECFRPEKDRLSLAQLAAAVAVPKSSLFRVVKELAGMDYLRYDE